MAGVRGSLSAFTKIPMDELVQIMLNNDMIAKNIRLYQKNKNMNSDTCAYAATAYKKYLKLKADIRKENKRLREKEKKAEQIAKWNENHPKSFRYRTVEEIYVLIRDHQDCFELAQNYLSPCKTNTRLEPALIERTRKALVRYYKKKDPTNPKLQKLLARAPAKVNSNDS